MNIIIYGNVPSSKNSQQWTGTYLVSSRATQKYIKDTKIQWAMYKRDFHKIIAGKEKPYYVGMKFIRGTRHKFDYINPAQTIQDLMVKHGWIDDDNCDEIIPVFYPYEYDKENPGVEITIN